MQLKVLASGAALAIVLGLSGAIAQEQTDANLGAGTSIGEGSDTINGVTIPEEDRAAVAQHCSDLQAFASSGTGQDINNAAASTSTGEVAQDPPEAGVIDQAITTIDLDAVTLEACIEAGFVTQ